MVRGLHSKDHLDQICEGCLLGKHAQNNFPKDASTRATYVHGSIHLNSFGKNKYFLLFIDDFSRKFLKEKSKVCSAFKKFKVLIEKERDHNIKAMRFDRGCEFTSIEFEEYCENHGIYSLLMVLYSPQQNG